MDITFVISYPRSRTCWLANFFTTEYSLGLHEPLRDCKTLDDLELKLNRARENNLAHVLVADTGAAFFVRQLSERYPDAKFIFVHRDPIDVSASLKRIGIEVNLREYTRRITGAGLALVSAKRAIHTNVRDLDNEGIMRAHWNYCCDTMGDFPVERYRALKDVKVELLPHRIKEIAEQHKESLTQLMQQKDQL